MATFNRGKPYHGSPQAMRGGIKGATDTDYFYFFCPQCQDQELLRILDYDIRSEQPGNPYNETLTPKAEKSFVIAFKVHCQKCNHTDFVKISNIGWQGGKYGDVLSATS